MKYINKYQNFVSEKLLLESLLLESNVIYSSKFKKILTKMKENRIAKELLSIENQDLNVSANFFDIKIDDDNVVTFTNDRAAQNILNNDKELVKWTGNRGAWLKNTEANADIFKTLGYDAKIGTEVYHPNNTEIGEIISEWVSPKTNKTWCYVKFEGGEGVYNKAKLADAKVDLVKKVFSTRRQEVRTGRAMRSLLDTKGITYTAAEIETFVNEFKGTLSIMNDVFSRFEIVDGEDLLFWYHRKNYEFPSKGSLGSSCQAVGRKDWLEIYIDNPDTVKLLILKSADNDDKIVGRALLWKLEDGKTMMDQIYVSNDPDYNVFKEYARSKGYIIKNDEPYAKVFVAYLKPKPEGYEKYPSIDNMRYWDKKTGKISNRWFDGCKEIIWSEDDDDGGDYDADYDEDGDD